MHSDPIKKFIKKYEKVYGFTHLEIQYTINQSPLFGFAINLEKSIANIKRMISTMIQRATPIFELLVPNGKQIDN